MDQRWTPPGVHLPQHPLDPETVAAIIRITGGNFRLLNRLLTQMERILEINSLTEITKAVVEPRVRALLLGVEEQPEKPCKQSGPPAFAALRCTIKGPVSVLGRQ